MKKALILTIMFIFTATFMPVSADNIVVAYDFDVIQGCGYDLESGQYKEDITLSSTTKMILSKANSGYELQFLSLNFSHVLFFNDNNQYIGYINGNASTYENEKHLGYDATTLTNYPSNAYSFTIVNYDYDPIREQVAVTNPTIDDIAWENLTYRDIFGDNLYAIGTNNLVENGNFVTSYENWQSYTGSTNSIINEELVSVGLGTQNIIRSYYLITADITHTFYYSADIRLENSGVMPISIKIGDGYTWDNYEIQEESQSSSIIFEGLTLARIYMDLNYTTAIDSFGDMAYLDNTLVYDLTDLFDPLDLGNTLPTITEFETMLDFYKLYVDVPEEITYNDIFVNTNLIVNGDFADGVTGWSNSTGTIFNVVNEVAEFTALNSGNALYQQQNGSIGDLYYYSADLKSTFDEFLVTNYSFATVDEILYYTDINYWETLTIIASSVSASNNNIQIRQDSAINFDKIYIDNVKLYSLTDIFYPDLEPDINTFEGYYSIWVDPVGDYYSVYLTASHLSLLGISYEYEQAEDVVLNVDSGLDTFLNNINMNSPEGKAGLGILTLILIVILIGFITKSKPITIISLIVAFLMFTVIGWFPVWIVIIITMALVFLALFKSTN